MLIMPNTIENKSKNRMRAERRLADKQNGLRGENVKRENKI